MRKEAMVSESLGIGALLFVVAWAVHAFAELSVRYELVVFTVVTTSLLLLLLRARMRERKGRASSLDVGHLAKAIAAMTRNVARARRR
jgi:hypothetical protein